MLDFKAQNAKTHHHRRGVSINKICPLYLKEKIVLIINKNKVKKKNTETNDSNDTGFGYFLLILRSLIFWMGTKTGKKSHEVFMQRYEFYQC